MGLTGSKAVSKGKNQVTFPPLDTKSKCGIVAFAIIGVAGGALLCLGSINFFGPVGSFNFIATVSAGGVAVLMGAGGITYLVVRDRKPAIKSEVRSQKSGVEKRDSSPSFFHYHLFQMLSIKQFQWVALFLLQIVEPQYFLLLLQFQLHNIPHHCQI